MCEELGLMLRTPGSPWSSRRRPCTLVERLAAVRIVAQPDRQGQLGKADAGASRSNAGRLWHWWERLQVGSKGRLLLSMLAVTARGTPKPPSLIFPYNMLIGMAVGGVLNTALVVDLLARAGSTGVSREVQREGVLISLAICPLSLSFSLSLSLSLRAHT